ncbi:MAG: helix-turn-helix domain-containing protein [Pseudonocardia sp.]
MSDRMCCLRCGARLRLDNLGELCDPCTRARILGGLLPPEFFTDDERMRRALAGYDFATVFLAIRRTTGYSQERLGELIELPQERISRVERGIHRLRDIAIVARLSSRTGIPADLLGFTVGVASVGAVGHGHSNDQEVDWMRRRTFFAAVTGVTVGLGVPLDLDRLAALVPGAGRRSPRSPACRRGALWTGCASWTPCCDGTPPRRRSPRCASRSAAR